ncbi:MAG TPA: hypothetical protein GXZ60_13770 [Intrasporangiaceae bacterium]|nr:hypothetical protein [Intrasporangiaceae bacterium]
MTFDPRPDRAATFDSPSRFDRTLLRAGSDLRQLGIDPAGKGWHRVRRGIWLPPGTWGTLDYDRRFQAFVHATVLSCDEPTEVILAAHSAAALLGMPSIGPWPKHVRLLDPEGVAGSSRHIRMFHGEPAQPIRVDGVLLTPPDRTIVDLARVGTLDTALAAADYALRTGMCTREQIAAEAALIPAGARNRGVAHLVAELADGRSESAGESLSRLQMFRANFVRPELQTEFYDSDGFIGRTDFDFEEAQLVGEFDGQLKYKVPPDASPQEAGEIVWREKQREDRLRRQRRIARWVWQTARDTAALARLLIEHGLKPQPRSTWIDLGHQRRRAS